VKQGKKKRETTEYRGGRRDATSQPIDNHLRIRRRGSVKKTEKYSSGPLLFITEREVERKTGSEQRMEAEKKNILTC